MKRRRDFLHVSGTVLTAIGFCAIGVEAALWAYLGRWPLLSVGGVTQQTRIRFPESATLVRGFCDSPAGWTATTAIVRVPVRDLDSFVKQPCIGEWPRTPANDPPSERRLPTKDEFAVGWNPRAIRDLRGVYCNNGLHTYIQVDFDDASTVRIFVHSAID